MDHKEGVAGPVTTISRRVKELRTRKGWTGEELGKQMTAHDIRWDRSIVANLENGRRGTVSVTELLTLARVFDVSPVHLLVPLEDVDFQITPKESVPATRARAWIRGWAPLPGTDQRIFRSEVPLEELEEGRIRPATEEERHIARKALGVPERKADDGEQEH